MRFDWWFFTSNTGVLGIGSGCVLSFDLVRTLRGVLRSLFPVFVFSLGTGGLPLVLDSALLECCGLSSIDLDDARDSDSDAVSCFMRDSIV